MDPTVSQTLFNKPLDGRRSNKYVMWLTDPTLWRWICNIEVIYRILALMTLDVEAP